MYSSEILLCFDKRPIGGECFAIIHSWNDRFFIRAAASSVFCDRLFDVFIDNPNLHADKLDSVSDRDNVFATTGEIRRVSARSCAMCGREKICQPHLEQSRLIKIRVWMDCIITDGIVFTSQILEVGSENSPDCRNAVAGF